MAATLTILMMKIFSWKNLQILPESTCMCPHSRVKQELSQFQQVCVFCLNPLHISRSTNWVEKDGKFLKTCAWWKKESTDTWATITAKEYTTWYIMVHVGHEGVSKIEPAFDESTIYCLHQYFPVCNLRVVSHLFLEINISCNRKKTYGLFI